MKNNDLTRRSMTTEAGREIKSSAHYQYVVNGITLDGASFAPGELVLEGQCLVRDKATGLFVKYDGAMDGFDSPCILDESVKFRVDDNGENPNLTAGQVITHGAVYEGMLIGFDEAFRTALGSAVRFDRD